MKSWTEKFKTIVQSFANKNTVSFLSLEILLFLIKYTFEGNCDSKNPSFYILSLLVKSFEFSNLPKWSISGILPKNYQCVPMLWQNSRQRSCCLHSLFWIGSTILSRKIFTKFSCQNSTFSAFILYANYNLVFNSGHISLSFITSSNNSTFDGDFLVFSNATFASSYYAGKILYFWRKRSENWRCHEDQLWNL